MGKQVNEQTLIKNENTLDNFKKAYGMLPADKQVEFREKVCNIADWSSQSFYNKKNGKTPIKKLETHVVISIFYEYGIDPNTNKYV